MTAYIFDTETTDRKEGEIIEAALVRMSNADDLFQDGDGILFPFPYYEAQVSRFRPSKQSTMGALAVHHILPSELEGCPPSHTFKLPDDCEYVVGHSVDFDWEAAGSPSHVKRICTYAMAQWVWPDATGYSQTALIYMLNGPTPETRDLVRNAHSAGVDLMLNLRILSAILELKPEIRTWSQLWQFSEECRIPRTCPMKKYEGVTLDELVDLDSGFVGWCLRLPDLDPYYRKGLMRALDRQTERERQAAAAFTARIAQDTHVGDCACDDCRDDIPF
jgi:exodeoxyribonuclease X